MRFVTIAKSMYKGWKVRKRTSMKRKIIIAVAVSAGILAAVAIISILAQTPVPICRAEDNPEFQFSVCSFTRCVWLPIGQI